MNASWQRQLTKQVYRAIRKQPDDYAYWLDQYAEAAKFAELYNLNAYFRWLKDPSPGKPSHPARLEPAPTLATKMYNWYRGFSPAKLKQRTVYFELLDFAMHTVCWYRLALQLEKDYLKAQQHYPRKKDYDDDASAR